MNLWSVSATLWRCPFCRGRRLCAGSGVVVVLCNTSVAVPLSVMCIPLCKLWVGLGTLLAVRLCQRMQSTAALKAGGTHSHLWHTNIHDISTCTNRMFPVSSKAHLRNVVLLSASFLVVLLVCFPWYIAARNGQKPFFMLGTRCLVQLASVVLRACIFWDSFWCPTSVWRICKAKCLFWMHSCQKHGQW